MTNLEWLRSLSVDKLSDIIFGSRCNMCAYQEREDCPTDENRNYDCNGGFQKWCNAIHIPKIKPCANCGGKAMFISDVVKLNPEIGYVQCCECLIRTSVGKKHDVVKKWNRRANDDEVDGD